MPDDYATGAINGEETLPGGDTPEGTGVPKGFTFESLSGENAPDEGREEEEPAPGPEEAGDESVTEEPVIDEGLVEKLKQSLRAVAAERNRLKEELAMLAGASTADSGAAPESVGGTAGPREYSHPDKLYRDAGKHVDPILAGMPFDPSDETVYIGDPSDLERGGGRTEKWVAPEDAIKLVTAENERKLREQLAQKYYQLQAEQILSAITERYESSLREMREKVIPNLPDQEAKLLDDFLKAYMSFRLGLDGYEAKHFVELDENALAKGAEYLRQSVEDFRKLFASLSRIVNQSLKRAADTAPVESAHSAAVPQGKSPEEMTPAEHRAYLRQQVQGLFGS